MYSFLGSHVGYAILMSFLPAQVLYVCFFFFFAVYAVSAVFSQIVVFGLLGTSGELGQMFPVRKFLHD